MALSLLQNLKPKPDAARARENYRQLAAGYEGSCARIEPLRLHAVRELALRPGETVFDIACGTGATLPMLASAVGPSGTTVGVELSPEMAEQAQRRINALNCGARLRLDCCAVEDFRPAEQADALLLCYTHDVLQSPAAVDRLIESARPGARIVVLGMKTLPWPWGWPVNLFNLYRARRYMTTYTNIWRPWRLLEERGAALREVHTALWGSAYIATGTLPPGPTRQPAAACPLSSSTPSTAFNHHPWN